MDSRLVAALEHALIPRLLKFKNEHPSQYQFQCEHCGSFRFSKWAVPYHYRPKFIDVAQSFHEKFPYKVSEGHGPGIRLIKVDRGKYKFHSTELAMECLWLNYHEKNAVLSLICKSCYKGLEK